ncbi:MAG: hypothetical protein JKY96_08135, partial [Phycisphaerales bacterium]|nr:hypothetical protein [Phycisphaerales bacterium]
RAFSDGRECSQDAKAVLDAALQLPETYREPVLMRCLKNMSYKQIGAVLELPETTIETRIARGRRMLREIVQMNEHNEKKDQQHSTPKVGATAEIRGAK